MSESITEQGHELAPLNSDSGDDSIPKLEGETGIAEPVNSEDIPAIERRVSANSYIGCARLLCHILLFVAALSLACSGYIIYRAMTFPEKSKYGYQTIMPSFVFISGRCSEISKTSDGLLICVNLLASLCLAISSYLQQLCTSPTQKDIVSEMDKFGDLVFGTNSLLMFFRRMSKRKVVSCLWVTLVVTSLPMHLLLNGSFGLGPTLVSPSLRLVLENMTSENIVGDELGWTYLDSNNCYSTLYNIEADPSSYNVTNLTVVTNIFNESECSGFTALDYNFTTSPAWTNAQASELASLLLQCHNIQIAYCLAEGGEVCGLVVRWLPWVIFSASLTVKAIVATLAFNLLPHFKKRLYTNIGDFIYFAVENPEYTIPNESLASKRRRPKSNVHGVKTIATKRHKPWAFYLGVSDWVVYILWLIGVFQLWWWSFKSLYESPWSTLAWDIPAFGLDYANIALFINYWLADPTITSSDILAAVAWGNIIQISISIGYLLFDNQVTRLWQEREWRSFYRRKKQPRVAVTSKRPGTRPTRWLQLPYYMSIFLITMSTILHWLGSQAVFVVEAYQDNFQPTAIVLYTLPLPLIILSILATIIVLTITIIWILPQRSPMPVMAGSARVVLASCYRLTELPPDGIMYGDITEMLDGSNRKAGFAPEAGEIAIGELYT